MPNASSFFVAVVIPPGARHHATPMVQPTPPIAPRRRLSGLQIAWFAAILLGIGGASMMPFARHPKIVAVWPGHGPDVKPKGWDERRGVFAAREAADRGAVVFAGDSITAWWAGLPEAFPKLKVANRGISGDTSRGLLARFHADVLALEPRAVVILIGTNDLHLGAKPADVTFNVHEILDLLDRERPGTPVVLCCVMPRKPEPGLFPDELLHLNAQLRSFATVRRGVTWCDTWEVFATDIGGVRDDEFPDGLHPNEAGYAKFAEALRAALKSAGVGD
ncbi:MAG: acetylhydrolase [Planctomycetes bacterium]|nr:acetylhydrolase [Planctomycetota bacterium]